MNLKMRIKLAGVLGRFIPRGSALRAMWNSVAREAFQNSRKGIDTGWFTTPPVPLKDSIGKVQKAVRLDRGSGAQSFGSSLEKSTRLPSISPEDWKMLSSVTNRFTRRIPGVNGPLRGVPAKDTSGFKALMDRRRAERLQLRARNARGADALQYFISRNTRNPVQRGYTARMPLDTSGLIPGGGYTPSLHAVVVNAKDPSVTHTLGHELGHAIDYTRQVPKVLADARGENARVAAARQFGMSDGLAAGPITRRFRDGGMASDVLRFADEINANRMYDRVMRRSLQGNPELYKRFQRQSRASLTPGLSTYALHYEKQLQDSIPYLPPRLRRSAERYLAKFKAYKRKVMDPYLVDGRFPDAQSASRFMNDQARAAYRKDPTLWDDIYNYAVQQGMPVNTNAWYNRLP